MLTDKDEEASTQWAVKDWALNRSFLDSRETVLADLLRSHDAELVCKWMCRKTDGSPYPPATLTISTSSTLDALIV